MTADSSDVEDDVLAHARNVALDFRHWRVAMPEGEPLRFIHVYPHPAGHWHYVTDGLAGLGIELTYRVGGVTAAPSAEPLELLRRLAHSISHDRQVPAAMHTIVLEPPIAPDSPFVAVAVVPDPELDGAVTYLQCVGITADEAETCVRHSTEAIVDRLREADPLFVTNHDRAEIALAAGAQEVPVSDGRTVPTLRWERDSARDRYVVWIEPERMRASFAEHLLRRVGRGAPLRLSGPAARIDFEASSPARVEEADGVLRIFLDDSAIAQIAASRDRAGALLVGPCELNFIDEPGPALGAFSGLTMGAAAELVVPPHVAHRRARAAFDAGRFEEVLALVPRAVLDGDHGLLAELLHIDTLRRMGRTEAACGLFASTADEWLGGKRRAIWDTQWKKLAELAKKLKIPPTDPRMSGIAERAR